MNENKEYKSKYKYLIPISIVGTFILVFFMEHSFIVSILLGNELSEEKSIEALDVLFSGLAFGALIVTLWLQREELLLQREELKATREELEGQKNEMQKQNQTIRLQQFENTFFNLLKNLEERKKTIKITQETGDRAIIEAYRMLKNFSKYESLEETAKNAWSEIRYGNIDSHINRIKVIIEFICESNLGNKRVYFQFLISNLSDHEYVILYFAGLSEKFNSLKKLIEKVSFFSYFDKKAINEIQNQWLIHEPHLDFEKYNRFYEESAFKIQ